MSAEPLEEVRVGIIGPSWWVDYWHLTAIKNHPQAEIHAVCGTKDREPQEITAKYGVQAQAFTNYEQMLDSVPLDGVIVCTPNDVHHPATMAVLKRGLHVNCEKPIALNAAQAKEMADCAHRQGVLAITNFPYRGNPCIQEMRSRIAAGSIGKILHVAGQYHGGFGLHGSPNWRGNRERSGSGILGDLGSHLIDLARYTIGEEFASVCGHTLTMHRDEAGNCSAIRTEDPRAGSRNDDSCAFLAELASGAQGVFHTSWVAYQGAYKQHQELDVFGTEGRLHFIANHSGTVLREMRIGDDSRLRTIPVAGVISPQEMSDEEDWFRPGRNDETSTTYRWLEAIRTRQTSISPDLTEGLRAQEVIDAVLRASAERRWIDVRQHPDA